MVTLVAVGVFFIATGPCLALLLRLLYPKAHLLVLSILGAFAWCLAMMLSGVVYYAVPPLRDEAAWLVFVIVTMQELMRFFLHLIFRTMARHKDGIEAFLRPGATNELLSGLAIGVGYGLLSALVNFYSAIVDQFSNDTAIYTDECPVNFFVAGGSYALAFSVLHICLGMLIWPSYTEDPVALKIAIGYFIHLGMSEATLINRLNRGCVWGLSLVYSLLGLLLILTFARSRQRIKKERQ